MTQSVPLTQLPERLQSISGAPQQLYIQAAEPGTFADLLARPRIAIVGTRSVTAYGKVVTSQLAQELAARGIVIISGLALGVDGIAHRAALDVGGLTLAVLPSPVEDIHPKTHRQLAREIVAHRGALVSEYAADSLPFKQNFVARNRIVSGLSDALLITEAAENSGTMHTAGFALEQGLTVYVVPGNITSPMSAGTNKLIKQGATPVTTSADILESFQQFSNLSAVVCRQRIRGANHQEQTILDLIEHGVSDGAELLRQSRLAVEQFNHHMTMLEITTKIRALGANHWGLA